jgi:hypothetical protein
VRPAWRYDNGQASPYAFYERVSEIPPGFDAYGQMLRTWASAGNVMHADFEIFGAESDLDARDGRDGEGKSGAWRFCAFDEEGVGFPGTCGPEGPVEGKWASAGRGGQADVAFFVRAPGRTLVDCAASCDDGVMNGDEASVDCGGSCPACACPAGWRMYDVSFCEKRVFDFDVRCALWRRHRRHLPMCSDFVGRLRPGTVRGKLITKSKLPLARVTEVCAQTCEENYNCLAASFKASTGECVHYSSITGENLDMGEEGWKTFVSGALLRR